jgi:hypothetical protein
MRRGWGSRLREAKAASERIRPKWDHAVSATCGEGADAGLVQQCLGGALSNKRGHVFDAGFQFRVKRAHAFGEPGGFLPGNGNGEFFTASTL